MVRRTIIVLIVILGSSNLTAQNLISGKWKLDSVVMEGKHIDSFNGFLEIANDSSYTEQTWLLPKDTGKQMPINFTNVGLLEHTNKDQKFYKFPHSKGQPFKDYDYCDFLKLLNPKQILVYHYPAFAGDISYKYYYSKL